LSKRDRAIEELETRKKDMLKVFDLQEAVNGVLTKKGNLVPNNEKSFLAVAKLKLLCKWKKIKLAPSIKKANLLVECYNNPSPQNTTGWSDEDKAKLVKLRLTEVSLRDTALLGA
jgi:hypothetical protein